MVDRTRPTPRRTIATGAVVLPIGALLVFAPLLLGRGSLNRYIVLIGLLCAFVGASLLLHGTWDLIRARRR
jgi:hypothetical protein